MAIRTGSWSTVYLIIFVFSFVELRIANPVNGLIATCCLDTRRTQSHEAGNQYELK